MSEVTVVRSAAKNDTWQSQCEFKLGTVGVACLIVHTSSMGTTPLQCESSIMGGFRPTFLRL